jgi:hypothetical protein
MIVDLRIKDSIQTRVEALVDTLTQSNPRPISRHTKSERRETEATITIPSSVLSSSLTGTEGSL